MTADSERREVARRLRGLPTDMYEVEELWEMKGLDTCCKDQTDYYLIHFALFECFPVDHMHPCDYEELHTRLADLIEPSEPKVKCVAEVKVDGERLEELVHDAAVELTGIDRDALLEEVKELEKCAWYFGLDFDEDEPLRDRLKEAAEDFAGSARRIREAMGVER